MIMEAAIERHRDDLRVFAYRMLGSLLEAECLVEQVFSLASFKLKSFRGEDSIRALLYGLIVRICLDALATQPLRTLPSLSYPPTASADPPAMSKNASPWLEPFPDELYPDFHHENISSYGARELISLPFIAALQYVPPQQRAIIVFCDTMGWLPNDVADLFKISNSDVSNLLDRARGIMVQQYRSEMGRMEPPAAREATGLLMQYLHHWETADLDALMDRLTAEVTLQILPSSSWYQGSEAVRRYLVSHAFVGSARGRWHLLPRRANGQLAFGTYELDDAGLEYVAHSIQVLTFEDNLVSEIISFANRLLFPAFKLRSRLIAQGRMTAND
jgi:RNA polymerase sigma-70 factor (ECF subfamily)